MKWGLLLALPYVVVHIGDFYDIKGPDGMFVELPVGMNQIGAEDLVQALNDAHEKRISNISDDLYWKDANPESMIKRPISPSSGNTKD